MQLICRGWIEQVVILRGIVAAVRDCLPRKKPRIAQRPFACDVLVIPTLVAAGPNSHAHAGSVEADTATFLIAAIDIATARSVSV